jgi:hydroxyethylthiazole kinase-like uncharacterized protein yjeF
MTELLTAAQMRAIEQAAIASGEVTGLELMERAGRGVVEAIMEWRPELATTAHRAVVLCGPGNNGGDGFVVARLLKERGWEVEVFLYGDEAKLPPDAAENARRWREMGEVRSLQGQTSYEGFGYVYPDTPDIFVDALFGTGLTRSLSSDVAHLVADLYQYEDLGVSVDLPSGYCSDSGRFLSEVAGGPKPTLVPLVVTFECAKLGHFLGDLPRVACKIVEHDIGVEEYRPHQMFDPLVAERTYFSEYSVGANREGDHKYTHGHALILSGGVGKGGAARLAARGALRIGAGLVTLGPPPAAIIENAAQLNAIMLRRVADADALAEILEDERLNALCLGPGLGVGAHTLGLVAAALSAKRGTVLTR